MLAAAASRLNIQVVILDEGPQAPAKQILSPNLPHLTHVDGSFSDPEKIRLLASKVDVLTVEIEHVDVSALEHLESDGVVMHPTPSTIRIIQDKLMQKYHLAAFGVPLSPYVKVESTVGSVQLAAQTLGIPLMLKSRTYSYDGRGNFVLQDLAHVEKALAALKDRPLYAEKWVTYAKEVAVTVVRASSGEMRSYPAVETVHKDNICHLVFAPLRDQNATLIVRAQAVAEKAIQTLEGAGVFTVEMFLMEDGTFYVNEIAPRPHNSGHFTIEACETSQYENHIRAILSLPLGSTALKVPTAAMLNIIGASSDMTEITTFASQALSVPGVTVHLYGKAECRKGRKMGHVTVVADCDAKLRLRLRPLLQALPSGTSDQELDLYAPAKPLSGKSNLHPLVGVIMGSDSDLPIMLPAAQILDSFEIPYELTIVSAHRTPMRLVQYSRSAAARGLRVIIAGAGGAAHLPGMVAAMTPLPVIGVPVKGSTLDGVDSLYSIVQMPRGVPVASVAINNGQNAGLLAVRVLSASMPSLIRSMEEYLEKLERDVLAKVDHLEAVGWESY